MNDSQDIQLPLDLNGNDKDDAEKNKEKEILLQKISSFKLDTMTERVAWILNNYPDTRNSDITLQIKYWEHFDADNYSGSCINVTDLYGLTRLTSLARSRAKIQNTYRLFLADEQVRAHRGKLEKEEKGKVISEELFSQSYTVYADESGKTERALIVGSVWILNPFETYKMTNQIVQFKKDNKYNKEFHFKDIDKLNDNVYHKFADFLKEHNSFMSFKAVSIENRGIINKQDALIKLYYHLLRKGIEHENTTGRAPLPRTLIFFKDREEIGFDKLLLSQVVNDLRIAEKSIFNDNLRCGTFESCVSENNYLIQIADLFVGCVNRRLNTYADGSMPKDRYADYFLKSVGIDVNNKTIESKGDLALHIYL
jgi:hypothetical protein